MWFLKLLSNRWWSFTIRILFLTENKGFFWNVCYGLVIVQNAGIRILAFSDGVQLSLLLLSVGYLEMYFEWLLRHRTPHTDHSLHFDGLRLHPPPSHMFIQMMPWCMNLPEEVGSSLTCAVHKNCLGSREELVQARAHENWSWLDRSCVKEVIYNFVTRHKDGLAVKETYFH